MISELFDETIWRPVPGFEERGDITYHLHTEGRIARIAFDRPDVFDVTRDIKHHVGFGFGTHVCLGAPLARMELRIMFEHLLARVPEWHLAPGTEPKVLAATFARAWDSVTIEFEPR